MARLGARIEVADKILNHASGKLGGIVGIYQKYEFLPERKAALDAWAAFIADLTRLRRPEQLAAAHQRLRRTSAIDRTPTFAHQARNSSAARA